MKKISIILGLSLIITGLSYLLLSRKNDECVEEKPKEPKPKKEDEKEDGEIDINEEIKKIVLSKEYNDPSELVLLVINNMVQKAKSGFAILQEVPKNIEELDNWIDEHGLRAEYEEILYDKFNRED